MTRKRVVSLVAVACLLFAPVATFAQSGSGAIAGVVKDTTGAVLPGVTVEAASPALIEKVRTVVSDEQGLYKIIDLRPGVYAVTFTLPGFSTVKREGIELTASFTATVNADLRVGTLEETVTVSGQAPIVDVQSVVQQKVISRDVLNALPTRRSAFSAIPFVPGVVGGLGEIGRDEAGLSIHGSRSGEAQYQVNGMSYNTMSGRGGGAFTYYLNEAIAQEIAIETSGLSAENEVSGLRANVIPKEGGNTLSGFLFLSYGDENTTNSNLTDDLKARGLTAVNSLKRIWDINPAWGGPIKKDKLWFYHAARYWGSINYIAALYFNETPQAWIYTPDYRRQAETRQWDESLDLRLTWQINAKNKFSIFGDHQPHCSCNRGFSSTTSPEATGHGTFWPNYLFQANWSAPVTSRLLLEVGASDPLQNWRHHRQPGVGLDTVSVTEQRTQLKYRADDNYTMNYAHALTLRAAASYVTGSHAFKVGFTNVRGVKEVTREMGGDMTVTLLDGAPRSLTMWATPLDWREGQENLGVFAQDQWTVKRLTLNLGIRYDHFGGWVPAQSLPPRIYPVGRFAPARSFQPVNDVPKWDDISPRVGAAYDLFGDGKTALKVSLGRFMAGEVSTVARNSNPVQTTVNSATRTWNDLNRDFVVDCDLLTLTANRECGTVNNLNFGKLNVTQRYDEAVIHGFGQRGNNWEGSASVQHELLSGTSLNVGYFQRSYNRFTVTDNLDITPADYDPYCITASKDSRLPNGGGYQVCGLYDIKPTKFGVSNNNLITFASNFGKQTEMYNGVDVTVSARLPKGRLVSGGTSTGRTATNNCFVVDTPQQLFNCDITPPFLTQVKFFGVFPLPWNLQASAAFQSLPGPQILATYPATNAEIFPSLGRNLSAGTNQTVLVDLIKPGTVYGDRISNLDLRFTRKFRVGRTRMMGSLDAFNLLNSSDVLAQNNRYGPQWLVPANVVAGRWFKFAAQFDF